MIALELPRSRHAAAMQAGFFVGAAAGGASHLIAGFYSGFGPAAVLMMLILILREAKLTRHGAGKAIIGRAGEGITP